MLTLLLLTLVTAPVPVDLAKTAPTEVTVTHPTPDVVRLTQATSTNGYAMVGERFTVDHGALGASAEIRCGALWNRDARIGLAFYDAEGKWLTTASSEPVYRAAGWTTVQAYAAVPAEAKQAQLQLAVFGTVNAELDAGSWAEFRNVSHWSAPSVTISGPPLGIVTSAERWAATIEVGTPAARWTATLVDVQGDAMTRFEGRPGHLELSREPLPPGYYELRWAVYDADNHVVRQGRKAYASLPDWTPPDRSPFAVDAGFSWGIIQKGESNAKAAAELLYRIGLHRTRDRMSLSQTMKEPGKLVLGQYADAARVQHDAGLAVYTIIHDIPSWMATERTGPEPWTQPPGDLRDLHAWFAAAAAELSGTIDAWELWNEPDISFFAGRASEYAGIVKAGYLGVKAGKPDANVLLGSPAHALGPWINLVFESGVADYYDTFNFHTYREPQTIPHDTAEFRELQRRHGVDRPMWLTETGVTASPMDGDVLAGERFQAVDYVKRYALAANQRIEDVFAFYLQEWRQPGAPPYGVLRPDLTPRPALVSLATLTRLLGEGRPLGRQNDLPPGITALWFETGHGPAAIVWADRELPCPAKLSGKQWVNLFGAERTPPDPITTRPVYLIAEQAPTALDAPPPPPSPRTIKAAELASLQVVLDLRLTPENDVPWSSPERKQPVKVLPGQAVPATASIYNFGARPATVALAPELPEGWSVDGLPERVEVEPGGRQVVRVTVHVGSLPQAVPYLVKLTGTSAGYRIAPAVAGCAPATAQLEAVDLGTIGESTPAAERWTASNNEAMQVTIAPDGLGVVYEATMPVPEGNRWGFAQLAVGPADRPADGEGIRFQVTVPEAWNERLIVILHEADGSQYHGNAGMLDAGQREVRLLWSDFRLNTGVSQDENGQLDVDQVSKIGFGTSARGPQSKGEFTVGPVRVFRLKREP